MDRYNQHLLDSSGSGGLLPVRISNDMAFSKRTTSVDSLDVIDDIYQLSYAVRYASVVNIQLMQFLGNHQAC